MPLSTRVEQEVFSTEVARHEEIATKASNARMDTARFGTGRIDSTRQTCLLGNRTPRTERRGIGAG